LRTVIVGDVHGCADELEALLDKIAFTTGDRLVFVGDLIARGPRSLGVLDIARSTGALVVRGNHEQKLLDMLRVVGTATDPALKAPVAKSHREVFRVLRPTDWILLETSKLWLDLPDHAARVIHAGLDPSIPWERQRPDALLRIRTVLGEGPRGERHVLWGTRYVGAPHIVFGHNAAPGLQLHPWATGLDTGCVYGGRLTAMVLARGQKIPRSFPARKRLLVSEPARKVWFAPNSRVA
jgi:hypothetical protein